MSSRILDLGSSVEFSSMSPLKGLTSNVETVSNFAEMRPFLAGIVSSSASPKSLSLIYAALGTERYPASLYELAPTSVCFGLLLPYILEGAICLISGVLALLKPVSVVLS